MVIGFALGAVLLVTAHILLALHVEKVSADYFVSVGREVEPISGFLRATVIFYLEMLAPVFVALWMLWVKLLSDKKERLLRASSK